MIRAHLDELVLRRAQDGATERPSVHQLPNGSHLIRIPEVKLGEGWNRRTATVLFVAPVGYPEARPDCFWIEPGELRVGEHGTPQSSNDSNPIPGDDVAGRSTTWFSWHLQAWNPAEDTLVRFFNAILQRLSPAR
jgi:hypothetical protein